jgi:hypothetical protein
MKKIIGIVAVAGVVFTLSQAAPLYARGPQNQGMNMIGGGGTGNFVDLNGDGINDCTLDSDGDGIANRLDADYLPPQDGTGSGRGAVSGTGTGTPILDGTGPHGAGKRGR